MITIALDENGDFEERKGKGNQPVFIAGLLYDDRDNAYDVQNERERVVNYYQHVCHKAGEYFPEGLHVNYRGDNGYAVSKVKTEVKRTLREFLRSGTYDGQELYAKPRKGKYTLFMQLKSNQGKQTLLKKDTSVLLKDDFASNLYMHMAEDILSRVIFHNPYQQDIKKVYFDLPTRTVVVNRNDRKTYSEYQQLGYKKYVFTGDNKPKNLDRCEYLQVANENNYREIIARGLLAGGKINFNIEKLQVRAIRYNNNENRKSWCSLAFLYLADSICSYLDYEYEQKGSNPAAWLSTFYEEAHDLDGSSKNLFFAYDSLDTYFQHAWICCEQGQYFEALNLVFDAQQMKNNFLSFYQKHWFYLIEQYICQNSDTDNLEIAIKRFQQYSYSNNLQQEKLCYLFEQLEQAVRYQREEQQKSIDKASAFALYDAGMSAYNHLGQSKQAEHCFVECKKLAPFVDIETYLRTLNKYVVFQNDTCNFKKAKETAENFVIFADDLHSLRTKMFGDEQAASTEYGRNLSQCAQAYAFLRDAQAETYFKEALAKFEPESQDYYITLSYLLHYYIDQGNVAQYDEWSVKYFGGETQIEKQFVYLMQAGQGKHPRFSLKFAFFVFVKGLYKLHRNEVKGRLRLDLLHIETTFRNYHAEKEINGHPWELIYKYLAFLAWQQGKKDITADYLQKMEQIVGTNSAIMRAIVHNGRREFFDLTGNKAQAEAEKHQMADLLKELRVFSDFDDMLAKFCYMYD